MKGRRPGGGDLRGALGSLFRSTVEQMGAVKEVVERQAQQQRKRLDAVLIGRRRKDALAELGRVMHELALEGALGDLAEDPEVARALADVDAVAAELDAVESGATAGTRRGGWPRRRDAERPPPVEDAAYGDDDDDDEAGDEPGDEIAEAVAEEPPRAARARPAPDPQRGGIRFGTDDDTDDDDLEEYMHPDDVPPRGEEK